MTTTKLNNTNQKMVSKISTQNSNLDSAIIVVLKIMHMSSVYYTIGTFSNVYSSFYSISNVWLTLILSKCVLPTLRVIKSVVKWKWATGCGICLINFLLGQQLYLLGLYLTRFTWPIFRLISIPGHYTVQLVRFQKISA